MKKEQYKSDVEAVDALVLKYGELKEQIGKVIVGQEEVIRDVVISIFSRGHALLVGVPGLAKTLLVNTIANALGLSYSRIQFTPDLMPSDIIGTEILDENRAFRFFKGPVFANIILADEINRTPPKTQAALLEAMQEKAITVAGKNYKLSEPFFVLATQNPIEQEGTYPLPEAQLDRFMFNIWLDYPSFADEVKVVKSTTFKEMPLPEKVLDGEEIIFFQDLVRKIPVTDNVYEYAVRLASMTRPGTPQAHSLANDFLNWGAGPRASQYMILGAKCHAALHGKYAPDIEDIRAVAIPVLRHRIVRNYKAEAEEMSVENIIEQLMNSIR
jgi:MoxR-like ATPase